MSIRMPTFTAPVPAHGDPIVASSHLAARRVGGHICRLAGVVGVLLPGHPARATGQSAAATDSLLLRLTREAVAAAPAILLRDARARAASARVRPAGALPDPMVSVGVMDLTLPGFHFRESDFTEVDIELSQQFPWPGTLGAQGRAAQAMARGAVAETAVLRRDLSVRVARLYYRLRYVVSAKRVLTRQRALVDRTVELSTLRYSTGSVPQSDPLQARIALARLGTEWAALAAEEAALRADLRAVRGRRGAELLPVPALDAESIAATLAEVDSLHAADMVRTDPLAANPRLLARQALVDAADEAARAEDLTSRPDFEITTRYGARPLGADFFSAFVGMRIPLWAGRKQRLLTQAARIETEAAQRGLDEEQAALDAELERTLSDARAGVVRLRLLVQSVLPLAREGIEAALREYGTGQRDFLSVFAAVDLRYRVELEAAEVAAEHLTHLAMLEQLLTPEVIP